MRKFHRNETIMIYLIIMYIFIDLIASQIIFPSQSKKISNDQELIQSDAISCPQNQKGK